MSDLGGPPVAARPKFDAQDLRFIAAKRDAGVSWSNIAKMLGRAEADVRGTVHRLSLPDATS